MILVLHSSVSVKIWRSKGQGLKALK